jgi:hypothetical protein
LRKTSFGDQPKCNTAPLVRLTRVNFMKTSKRTTRQLPDFTSNVVSLSLIGEQWARVLVQPRWEIQGDRLFLVGTVAHSGSPTDWSAGVVDAAAWDQVNAYLLFDSPEHYAQRLAIYHRKKRKS